MRKNSGFTVIEIVVVFAIVAVLSTIGIASFVTYNQTQILQNAESQLKSTLNLAKSRAFSQAKPGQCASMVLNGYRVTISFSNRSYTFEAICNGLSQNPKTTTLHPDLRFDATLTNPTSYFFPVIVGGVQVQNEGTIVFTGYGQVRTIRIDPTGGIK